MFADIEILKLVPGQYSQDETRPSKQCEFCIHLHDKSLNHSGLPEWFSWFGVVSWSGWSGCSGGPGGPGGPGGQGCLGGQGGAKIKFVNVYGLHGLNNQIIEKT